MRYSWTTFALFFLLSACAVVPVGQEKLTLVALDFSALPGWKDDHQSEAIGALSASCLVLDKKTYSLSVFVGNNPMR